jgi:hypothetical protein
MIHRLARGPSPKDGQPRRAFVMATFGTALLAVLAVSTIDWASTLTPQKPGQPYALLVGTVFYEESGFLVRGAQIAVRQKDSKKHWETITNDEGSFSIRVPAGKAVYAIEARVSGREPDRKEVEVSGDERVDIVLHLKGK